MSTRTVRNTKRLFCSLGWHRPKAGARWNEGYYFTACSRCGADLVRTAYGRWHEPRGYRVVWREQAPPNAVPATLVRERAGEASANELPIQAVLRHLQHGEMVPAEGRVEEPKEAPVEPEEAPAEFPSAPAEPETVPAEPRREALLAEPKSDPAPKKDDRPAAVPEPETEIVVRGRVLPSRIPDFMDDDANPLDWEPARPAPILTGPAEEPRAAVPAADEGEPHPAADATAELAANARGVESVAAPQEADPDPRPILVEPQKDDKVEAETRLESPDVAAASGRSRRPRLGGSRSTLVLLPFALSLFVLLWGASERGRAEVEPPAHPAPISRGGGVPAFVTAGVLNCRSAPAREAGSAAVLLRGDAVRLLARDGEWVSLVADGGQCWALLRYFSVEPPL